MRRWMMVLLAVLLLAGCSAAQYPDSEFLGVWHATTGEQGGVQVKLKDIDSRLQLTLDDSGSAVMKIGGTEHKGKWSPDKDEKGIILVVDDERTTLTKVRDDALKGPLAGVTMTFERTQ